MRDQFEQTKRFLSQNGGWIAILLISTAIAYGVGQAGTSNTIQQEKPGYQYFLDKCLRDYQGGIATLDSFTDLDIPIEKKQSLGRSMGILDENNFVVDESVYVHRCVGIEEASWGNQDESGVCSGPYCTSEP